MNVLQPTKWAAIILLLISTQVFAQMSNEKKTFSNPVIYSDVPDVDVIRVDDTFYMISTTMHLMPGAPIMRSKDLVNWEIISYLYDEIKDSPFYDLEGGHVYSAGQWASSIRYHNGKFYVFFATNKPGKSYIYTATDPAGKWERLSVLNQFHDASLLFDDDGRVYLAHSAGNIRITELKSDLSGVKEDGLEVTAIHGEQQGYKGLFEGTHIFKHDGKYYMMLIWWPQNDIRTQLCFRSDRIEGPYESKTILCDVIDNPGKGVAQGCVIDTKDGEWYGFLFQDFGAVGRTPVLMPCRWEDGWPMLGDENGKVSKVMEKPIKGYPETPLVISDDFTSTKLALNWQWNHNPDNNLWSLTERPGYLRLRTGKVVQNIFEARNTLSQRTEGPLCSGIISIDISRMKDGDVTGLGAYNGEPGLISVVKEKKKKYIVMTDRGQEMKRVELKKNNVHLRMDCDFNINIDKARFYYSLDGKEWIQLGPEFQMIYYTDHFMGIRFAIYNYATKHSGGYVDVDFFEYSKEPLQQTSLKPRLVVLTDIAPGDIEPDDMESMIRLLVHADLYEIEALIASSGWNSSGRPYPTSWIDSLKTTINEYEKDLPNLMKRSEQTGFLPLDMECRQQKIGYWPSAEYLRSRLMLGSLQMGYKNLSHENRSAGSDLIIKLTDEADDRPLWITIWGGGNTLAQAIWQVKQERTEEQLKGFLNKLRVYTITDQDVPWEDRHINYPFSSHHWMRREFGKDLLFIWDESAWLSQNDFGAKSWKEYATHIQNHGNLGAIYPKNKWGVEGDTPSFLHLMPNGLNNPAVPNHTGWGGYFEWNQGMDNETYCYTNHSAPTKEISRKYEKYFYPATFNNFAARMDWASEGRGNRNPVVIVNGEQGIAILKLHPKQGSEVILDGSQSFDPDADSITFKWWVLPEAGSYPGTVTIVDANMEKARIKIPQDAIGKSIHVICEVTDSGNPSLTSYRRVLFEVSE